MLRRAPSANWQDGGLKEGSADVLPVRQQNRSKVDYYRYPRHQPPVQRRRILGSPSNESQENFTVSAISFVFRFCIFLLAI